MHKITLECPLCGEEDIVDATCPVTGWTYNEGWTINCKNCNSPMAEKKEEILVEDEKGPSQICEFCGMPSYVIYSCRLVWAELDAYIFICDECEDYRRSREDKS